MRGDCRRLWIISEWVLIFNERRGGSELWWSFLLRKACLLR
jgi:hypothetical protein